MRRVEVVFTLLVWLLFLILSLRVFGPDSAHTEFTSDTAIPILMSNNDRPITVFDTYYYAADRWGGWPMLIAKELHLKTGIHWTDQKLQVVRTTWVFVGLLVLIYLNTRAAPAVIISALIAISLDQFLRKSFFDLSQLYAWQLTALFFAWLCLRHLFAQRARSDEARLTNATFWGVAFYFCSFFAIWSSVASAPLIAVLVIIEAIRAHASFQPAITKRRIGLAIVLVLAASASELLMKLNYHRYCLKHFGNDFKTPMYLDREYLYQNLLKNWQNIIEFSLFPFIAVALCFVIAIAVLILYARVFRKPAILSRVMSLFKDDTATMIVAMTVMGVVNFVIMVCVIHVRWSLYENRFLIPTFVFGVISGFLTIYIAIRAAADRIPAMRYVLALLLVGAFVWLCVGFPARQKSERYERDQETALTLSSKAPRAILMGGYWETYIFAGLQPTNTMTPLPLEGRHVRIPWTPQMLRNSEQVVIEYHRSEFVAGRFNSFAKNGMVASSHPLATLTGVKILLAGGNAIDAAIPKESLPPDRLTQYGNVLKLQDAHFYQSGEHTFALYFNQSKKP